MTIAAIKKDLHLFIDRADDKKLKAMHLLLEKEVGETNYSKEELEKFYGILDKYENGLLEVLPVEATHNEIRASIYGK